MHRITVPKLNNNDEGCILLEWLHSNHAAVQEQDAIAVLETSKATSDLICEATGILHHLVQAGDECLFGTEVAYVFANEQEMHQFLAHGAAADSFEPSVEKAQQGSAVAFTSPVAPVSSSEHSFLLTKEAQMIVEAEQITEEQLQTLGKKLIKKADLLPLRKMMPKEESSQPVLPLSRRQLAIAETVRISHQTIPRSFAQIKVVCDNALDVLKQAMAKKDQLLGLPEVLVKLVADLHQKFPLAFAQLSNDKRLLLAEQPHVGITIDLGTGLFIPVLRNASALSLLEIADQLLNLRMKALDESFTEEDLQAGNISISLHNETDITFALPIILPGQICMFTLCSQQQELYLNKNGAVAERTVCQIGLAYDHRVINGTYAIQILQALKARLESLDETML